LVYDYELYQISIHFPAFQHLSSPDSILPYKCEKAQLKPDFFDRLSQRNVNVPLAFLLKGYTPDLCLAIHQLTDDGLARQLAGTVNILAEWLQAEVHACISLIQQNARDRKAARRLFLLQI